MKIIKSFQLKLFKIDYDFNIGLVNFGFRKFKFENTSFTFIYDWTLRVGFIAITKHQTKSFEELKKESDTVWNKKFERWEKGE